MKLLVFLAVVFFLQASTGVPQEPPEAIPESGEAQVRLLPSQTRSNLLQLHIEAFGETVHLNMEPSGSLFSKDFKMHEMFEDEEGRTAVRDVTHELDLEALENDLYHDEVTGASLLMSLDEEGIQVHGIVTDNLHIRAIPEERSADGRTRHVAFRVHQPSTSSYNDARFFYNPDQEFLEGDSVRYGIPSVVKPEVYVVVDSTNTKDMGGSTSKVHSYLGVFWNAVNQRYKTIPSPNIKLMLAGALMVKSSKEDFYRHLDSEKTMVEGGDTLNSFSSWLYKERNNLPQYDLAYLITGLDMYDYDKDTGKWSEGLAGIAWHTGSCVVDDRKRFMWKAGMGEDRGGYYAGVNTAAHEVAHLLGALHDGDKPSGQGGPGAESCPWSEGYLMSYITTTPNKQYFSPCTARQIQHFLQKSNSFACLREITIGSKIDLSSTLPGQIHDMSDQCRRYTGKPDAYPRKDVTADSLCSRLQCQYQQKVRKSDGTYIYTYTRGTGRPAADGSPCGHGGTCVDGRCK